VNEELSGDVCVIAEQEAHVSKVPTRRALALACVASGLITAACAVSAPEAPSTSELTGTSWRAEAIDGRAVTGARAPQVVFGAADRLTGSGGCNSLFGIYETEAGFIDVRGLGRTEMACEAPVMAQEAAFVAVLEDAARYRREANRLVIIAENGATVTLTAAS